VIPVRDGESQRVRHEGEFEQIRIAFLGDRFGDDATSARHRYAYIGDSANDAACFYAFNTTFGVANVAPSLPRLSVTPRYVAATSKGAGFSEICSRILELRN